jgi:hypothetical protein
MKRLGECLRKTQKQKAPREAGLFEFKNSATA